MMNSAASGHNRTFVQFDLGLIRTFVGRLSFGHSRRDDIFDRTMNGLFSFPNPVNEKAARVVAGAVLALVVVILLTTEYWLLIPLAYGFWARVLAGPTLSPLGWTAQNVIAPRLGDKKPVPGPPKRFSQALGAVMSTAALVLALVLGQHAAADGVLIVLLVPAGLESILGYCVGCKIFAGLMRAGLVPEDVCAECADVSARLRAATSTS
jgi:Domain of unknown function (DUF4395)